MLKIYLKHKIFDYCIKLFFDSIIKNFKQKLILKVGQRFSQIQKTDNLWEPLNDIPLRADGIYRNCEITHVYWRKFMGEEIQICEFKEGNNPHDYLMFCSSLAFRK